MAVKIERVAVLGMGVMGAQLGAHFSNAGIRSLAFDLSQDLAEKGIENSLKIKPAAFYNPKTANLITPCNYDAHLGKLSEVDWVIEVIAERLDWKQTLFRRIQPHLKPEAIISSNTSGLSISDMMQNMPTEFQKQFLGTHFFNPPRYMRLLEIIRGEYTRSEIVSDLADFCERVLGKTIVYGKDTPNFIANRIGIYGMMLTINLAQKMKLTVEEVDRLTGTIIGRPKSATFRTADLVGLDTLIHVSQTAHDKLLDDEERNIFQIPDILKIMMKNNWLGQKARKGFYQKVGNEILSLNLEKMKYGPQKKVRFDSYRLAKDRKNVGERIETLAFSGDKAGHFIWALISHILIYAANRIPEISDDIVSIDKAMKWGFGWELGPFETWDAIGLQKFIGRVEGEGRKVPDWVTEMLSSGKTSFYDYRKGTPVAYDIPRKDYSALPEKPNVISLKTEKVRGHEIKCNGSASLIDIAEGVACLEFHSVIQPVLNPIDGPILDLMAESLEIIPKNGFRGLVIGHQGQHFSAGADLGMILQLCESGNWDQLERISKQFQELTQGFRFAPFPIVCAPFNLCLGGGFEIAGSTDMIVASAELYCGAVEVGIGLIPGAGGNLRVLLNVIDAMSELRPGPFPPVQKVFETIGYGKVSTSAKEAVRLGYLKRSDRIVINPDQVIYEAKKAILELADNYTPPTYRDDIILPGEGGRLAIEVMLRNMVKLGIISEHDNLIGRKLAYVLTGGGKASPVNAVDEQFLLDLEREAFMSLCGEKLSHDRMRYMLEHGKPLRN